METSSPSSERLLLFLFVSPVHTDSFSTLVEQMNQYFHPSPTNQDGNNDTDDNTNTNNRSNSTTTTISTTQIIALIGGGVIGNGIEYDNPQRPSLSILVGRLPKGANVELHSWTTKIGESNPIRNDDNNNESNPSADRNQNRNPQQQSSYLIFGDPWSSVETVMKEIRSSTSSSSSSESRGPHYDIIMAGGITCPDITTSAQQQRRPLPKSLAINGQILEAGSTVVVQLSGTMTLQTLVAQGCRPISPPYTITAGEGNIIESLNGIPALKVLKELTAQCSPEDAILIRQELLCGIAIPTTSKESNAEEDGRLPSPPTDYLCRQLIGFVPAIQGIAIAAKIEEGDIFVFQVRDQTSAVKDMKLMTKRAKAARLFYQGTTNDPITSIGSSGASTNPKLLPQPTSPPKALAALQISCVARGTGLFQAPNVDVTQTKELLMIRQDPSGPTTSSSRNGGNNNNIPIAGFFANGEIGPVGLAGFSPTSTSGGSVGNHNSYIHGFTTVVAILCETATTTATGTTADAANPLSNDDSTNPTESTIRPEPDQDAWG